MKGITSPSDGRARSSWATRARRGGKERLEEQVSRQAMASTHSGHIHFEHVDDELVAPRVGVPLVFEIVDEDSGVELVVDNSAAPPPKSPVTSTRTPSFPFSASEGTIAQEKLIAKDIASGCAALSVRDTGTVAQKPRPPEGRPRWCEEESSNGDEQPSSLIGLGLGEDTDEENNQSDDDQSEDGSSAPECAKSHFVHDTLGGEPQTGLHQSSLDELIVKHKDACKQGFKAVFQTLINAKPNSDDDVGSKCYNDHINDVIGILQGVLKERHGVG